MNQSVVGELIQNPDDAGKDAIHVPIFPATCDDKLYPGQPVGIVGDHERLVRPTMNSIGIVDPFLSGPVFPGQWFYVFLLPGSISSLRHVWSHDEVKISESNHDDFWETDECARCNE